MSRSARILVVEDEEITRENLMHVLRREGYEVDAANDGEGALDLLGKGRYDVILTDLRMRHVDGMGVLAAAKGMQPETEVIMLTGYATVETAVAAMEQGAYHYLAKPYRFERKFLDFQA